MTPAARMSALFIVTLATTAGVVLVTADVLLVGLSLCLSIVSWWMLSVRHGWQPKESRRDRRAYANAVRRQQ